MKVRFRMLVVLGSAVLHACAWGQMAPETSGRMVGAPRSLFLAALAAVLLHANAWGQADDAVSRLVREMTQRRDPALVAASNVLVGPALAQAANQAVRLRIEHPDLFMGAKGGLVVEVAKDTQAAAAGIQQGDVVLSYAGELINHYWEFVELVGRHAQDGGKVELILLHNGARRAVALQPGKVGLRLDGVGYILMPAQKYEDASVLKSRYSEWANKLEGWGGIDNLHYSELYRLCQAYMIAGRLGKMQSCFSALQAATPGGRIFVAVEPGSYREMTMFAYETMARAYAMVGDLEKAQAAARRAVDEIRRSIEKGVLQGNQSAIFSPLSVLGQISARMGRSTEAAAIARQIEESQPDPSFKAPVWIYQSKKDTALGSLYSAMGQPELALQALQRSQQAMDNHPTDMSQLSREEQERFKGLSAYVTVMLDAQRAELLLDLGRTGGLEPLFDKALAEPRAPQEANYWKILFNRGRLAEAKGKDEEAIRYYIASVQVVERQRSGIYQENDKIGFAGVTQAVYARLVKALLRSNRVPEAFEFVERAKARALVDLLAARDDFAKPGAPNDSKLLLDLRNAREELDAVGKQNGSAAQGQLMRGTLDATSEALHKAAPELASLVTVGAIPEARLRSLLQPDETLLEYYYQDDDLYCFIATASSLRAVRLDGKGLSETVQRFRSEVQSTSQAGDSLSGALHARLIAPLGLPTENKLIIVPHGVLHYLPFNALHGTGGDLIDRYSIRLLPSASVLTFLKQRQSSGKSLLVLGNPDLGNPKYDLPGAQREAMEIARLRPDATLLMRAQATKDALRAQGGKYSYLHFASHGKFDPDHPLQSGLYLAGKETEGMLTVDELYSLDLHADLVTLSACETALGRINNGDDVIGLTRGFFYAGASSIIASLWPVDDEATYLMMTTFYRELARQPKAQALRSAQLAVRAKYPQPFYWAAFQLAGNEQ